MRRVENKEVRIRVFNDTMSWSTVCVEAYLLNAHSINDLTKETASNHVDEAWRAYAVMRVGSPFCSKNRVMLAGQ
jgi:hypothetical protein